MERPPIRTIRQVMDDVEDVQLSILTVEAEAIWFVPEPPIRPNRPHRGDTYASMQQYFDAFAHYEDAKASYQERRKEAFDHNAEIDNSIKEFIKEETGLYKLPPKQQRKVWDKAWEIASDSGFYAVYLELIDLIGMFE